MALIELGICPFFMKLIVPEGEAREFAPHVEPFETAVFIRCWLRW